MLPKNSPKDLLKDLSSGPRYDRDQRIPVRERAKNQAMYDEIIDNLEHYSSPEGGIPITDERLAQIFSDENLAPLIANLEELDRRDNLKR